MTAKTAAAGSTARIGLASGGIMKITYATAVFPAVWRSICVLHRMFKKPAAA
jgi:hypothetical protein